MGKLLDYIAKETQGECFASFKYCYDNMLPPNIEYEAKEDSYINMKEFAESIHDPHMRDMCPLAEKMMSMPPLFKYFLDGSRRVYKVDDIQYDKKVFPIVSGQISVSCCGREMNDDNTFRSFGKVFEEAYPVVCLPITANDEGIDNGVYFRFLSVRLNRLKNKLLANYLRNRGNDLATVRISAFCVAMLSNNPSKCKVRTNIQNYNVPIKKLYAFNVNLISIINQNMVIVS